MSRRRQPHRIPPPISYGPENLDSEVVLHEIPNDVGLLLWKTVRSVRLWGELPPGQRARAFDPNAYARRIARVRALDADRDVKESMETAAAILRNPDVSPEAVVTACRLIASWAEARGTLGTALEFTQAAAVLAPADAELILAVATLARRHDESARAESWYRQAIAVSRRTHEWISLAGAYLGLGSTFLERGSYSAARQMLIRGIRAATRHSLWEERALLAHELTRLAIHTDRQAEVVRSGRAALEAYGRRHPRLPRLAAELGVHWIRSGYLPDGRRLLQSLSAAALSPAERLERGAALVRAAGILGDAPAVERGFREARLILQDPSLLRDPTRALLDLARGAGAVGDLDRAREAAERALRAADVRDQSDLREEAEALLRATRGDAPFPEPPGRKGSREIRRLADDLANTLSASAEAA